MQYDFSKMTNRFGTNSLKWSVKKDELPMWVADMDFETAPEVVRAIQKKAEKGIFGYTDIPEEYYTAICKWWERRHNFKIEKDWILFCTGVVPAISSIVRKMTKINDNVLVQAPVYNIFYNSIINNSRKIISNDLIYNNGAYSIDWNDLEEKLSDPLTSMMILCNPHNPVGKVWEKEVLEKIGRMCIKHNVLVLSDEIHCDLTHTGYEYTPFASVSPEIAKNSISCIAPTKAFNLAGLQTASIVVPDEKIRQLVNRGINTDEVAEPNAFAIEATIAAFSKGEEWLRELIKYLDENRKFIYKFFSENIPELSITDSQATYLLWVNCSSLTSESSSFCEYLREKTGLFLSEGSVYGGNGSNFIRINYACPRERLEDGLKRLKTGIEMFKNK